MRHPLLCSVALLVAAGSSCQAAPTEPERESAPEPVVVVQLDEPAVSEPPALRANWTADEGVGGLSNAESYWVSYVLNDVDEVPLNEMFDLTVRVVDPETKEFVAASDAIRVDARMPAHGHGMKQDPVVEQNPDGSYTVRGMLLHMTGHWELYVDLRRGALTERAQFDIDIE